MKETKIKCDLCKQPITGERGETLNIDGALYDLHRSCKQKIKDKLEKEKTKENEKEGNNILDTALGFFADDEDENDE